jgi:hypothetical protein
VIDMAARRITIVAGCLAALAIVVVLVVAFRPGPAADTLTPTPTSGVAPTETSEPPTPSQSPVAPEPTADPAPITPGPTDAPADGEPVRDVPGQCWVFSGGGWIGGPCPDD